MQVYLHIYDSYRLQINKFKQHAIFYYTWESSTLSLPLASLPKQIGFPGQKKNAKKHMTIPCIKSVSI